MFKLFADISKMAPIKENCPDFISYDQIRLVLAQLTGLYKKSGGHAANGAVPEKVIMIQFLLLNSYFAVITNFFFLLSLFNVSVE